MEPGRSIAVAVFALLAAAADGRAHPPSFADTRLLPVPFTLPKMQLPFVLGKSGRRPAADVATTAAPPVPSATPLAPAAPKAAPPAPAAPSAAQPALAAPKAAPPAPAAPSAARAPPRENGPRNKPADAGVHDVRATTTVRPKPEASTHDRSIITALRKTCPEGQRMSPDRVCRTGFEGAEDDDDDAE